MDKNKNATPLNVWLIIILIMRILVEWGRKMVYSKQPTETIP